MAGDLSFIDAAGNVYFAGRSGPVTPGAAQTKGGGGACVVVVPPVGILSAPCSDAWVGKADPAGNTVFGSFLGGSTDDGATALTVDSLGNVFLAGNTGGSFPTTANAAIVASTTAHVFAAKISADGGHVVYSTYLPDSVLSANAIAIDGQGAAYIGGTTATGRAYVLKLGSDGGTIIYNSADASGKNPSIGYVGAATALAVDAVGNVVVAGKTTDAGVVVSQAAAQQHLAGVQNCFLARLDSSGNVVASTYFGGSAVDAPTGVAMDAAGGVFVAGNTTSPDFPTSPGAFQPTVVVPLWSDGARAGFVAKLSSDFRTLGYSSYVMTAGNSGVGALAVTPGGDAYYAGATGAGFPVTANAPQVCFQGSSSAFVAHLDPGGGLKEATYAGANVSAVPALSVAADGTLRLPGISSTTTLLQMRFGAEGWNAPACLSPTVLNAATFYGDDQGIAPGELVSLTGFGIGPDTAANYQPDAKGLVPRELGGVQVLFDGEPAPVLYAQSRQVNAQAPFELSGKSATSISLVYNGAPVGAARVRADKGLPGLFRRLPGASMQAVAVNQDGTVNGADHPAAQNSVVSLWGTGFPPLEQPCATGGLNPPYAVNLAAGWIVYLSGGFRAEYVGSAPGKLCGIVQINLMLPTINGGVEDLRPQSDNPLTSTAGGASDIGATVVVK